MPQEDWESYLIVLGHTAISPDLIYYLFSFHVPLFFFLSGYVFSVTRYPSFAGFLSHKCRTVLIPYVSFSIISVIAFRVIVEGNVDPAKALHDFLVSRRNDIFYNVPLWFLTTLFLVQVMYYLIKKHLKNAFAILVVLFALSAFAIYVLKTIEAPKFPWTFDNALYYLFFYGAGSIVSEEVRENRISNSATYAVFGAALLVNSVLLLVPYHLIVEEFLYNRASHVVWFPLVGLAGTLSVIAISVAMKSSRILQYLGRNSLVIFSLHVPFGLVVLEKIALTFNVHPQTDDVWGFAQTALILLILTPIIGAVNTYFPFLLGNVTPHSHRIQKEPTPPIPAGRNTDRT